MKTNKSNLKSTAGIKEMLDEGKVLRAWTAKQNFINEVQKHLQEYIDEAEHQDGWEYWLSITEEGDFVKDFGRYITAKDN